MTLGVNYANFMHIFDGKSYFFFNLNFQYSLLDNFYWQTFNAPLYMRMLGHIILSGTFSANAFFCSFCRQIVEKSGKIITMGNKLM